MLIDPLRRRTDPDNLRSAKRLRKQRPPVLRFLDVDGLDAANNQAGRQLRPGVITRKTSGCNRTDRGAAAHSIWGRILATCRQPAIPLLDYLVKLQQYGGQPPPASAPA